MNAKLRIIDRVVLPRYSDGSDWGSKRRVLARSATHLLYVWPGSFWSDNGGRHYKPTSLELAGKDRYFSGGWALGNTLHEGGRITKAVLAAHAAKIDKAFGCPVSEFLGPQAHRRGAAMTPRNWRGLQGREMAADGRSAKAAPPYRPTPAPLVLNWQAVMAVAFAGAFWFGVLILGAVLMMASL